LPCSACLSSARRSSACPSGDAGLRGVLSYRPTFHRAGGRLVGCQRDRVRPAPARLDTIEAAITVTFFSTSVVAWPQSTPAPLVLNRTADSFAS
jgi:hypothetical protein